MSWPTLSPNLLVLAIANTLDLPQRLSKRVGSRVGCQQVVFEPYQYGALTEIILSRFGQPDPDGKVFENAAVEFCARKVLTAVHVLCG